MMTLYFFPISDYLQLSSTSTAVISIEISVSVLYDVTKLPQQTSGSKKHDKRLCIIMNFYVILDPLGKFESAMNLK